jgi:3-hydroxyacyl-CoA dehydrogenase/enoyl-CoA hydratase/3-hydroxybutyryl-CoA epimerase
MNAVTESAVPTANWTLTRDDDNIAWLSIDCVAQSTNTLSAAVLGELSGFVDELSQSRPRGLVIASAKSSGFIVGADITEFKTLNDPVETAAMISTVHTLFSRIEAFTFPTVARIHGYCLGGGLELALACRYRVALDEPGTRLGLPEILLGLHPGFGGTIRSVERVGVMAAMDLMLTGRNVDAPRALKMGLVDRAVPQRYLDTAVRAMINKQPTQRRLTLTARLANKRASRPLVAMALRREVAKRALEQHYPAPYALIRLWQEYGGDHAAMFRAEARSIAELFVSATSRNLQRLFFLQERLKSYGRNNTAPIQHVHVIGAGTMGGDIAAWCAMRGLRVTLQDREIKYIAPAIKRAHATYKKRIRDRYRRVEVQDNLIIDLDGSGIAQADVIIEAIIENLDAKRDLFIDIEKRAKPDALIATNTSSIPLEDIAAGMAQGERLVGVHFFNPVAQMQLIEIIGGRDTDTAQLARAAAFAVRIDRQPLPARSSPGFLINRILSPYLQEAMTLLEQGVSPVVVDRVAKEFGMPMGPVELADTVGLDICLSVGEVLASSLGGSVPDILRMKVAQGRLGRKSQRGFYDYKGQQIVRPKADEPPQPEHDLRDRMLLRLLNEAVACLREGVVRDADLGDVGMVFGTGFAPFRGGPLHYARERGVSEIVLRLQQLENQYGERFRPDEGWQTLATTEAESS